jgi:hypothetical protein
VRSEPLTHGLSESMPVRAIRVSSSRAVSSLSRRKAHRPLVSQTRTPGSYPSCSAASAPCGKRTNQWAPGLSRSGEPWGIWGVRGIWGCSNDCPPSPTSPIGGSEPVHWRPSVLHRTDESTRADPDPGPRLRHRGFEHWLTRATSASRAEEAWAVGQGAAREITCHGGHCLHGTCHIQRRVHGPWSPRSWRRSRHPLHQSQRSL